MALDENFWENQFYFKPNIYITGTTTLDHTQMAFLQGEAAFITNGAWIENEMKKATPAGFEWGFMAFPGNNPGGKQVVLARPNRFGFIWKNKPTLIKKWAKEINSKNKDRIILRDYLAQERFINTLEMSKAISTKGILIT